ncbi:MAG: DUF1161 domain-containing protein [Burkholderiales bacterium]|nr:DUF1161 domain-containing protein [Burkholderiales bacterium]
MKSIILTTALSIVCCVVSGHASAKTSCDEVIAAIEAKLASKGVKKYTLLAVPKDEASNLRIVGTCDGGSKKITYKRD